VNKLEREEVQARIEGASLQGFHDRMTVPKMSGITPGVTPVHGNNAVVSRVKHPEIRASYTFDSVNSTRGAGFASDIRVYTQRRCDCSGLLPMVCHVLLPSGVKVLAWFVSQLQEIERA
jgi:hypothetical protein